MRLVAALALLAAISAPADACQCPPPSSRTTALAHADLVFVGTVVSQGLSDDVFSLPHYPLDLVTFAVDEVLAPERRVSANRPGGTVSLLNVSGESCGFVFETGDRYLVYGQWSDSSLLYASYCGRTVQADGASEEVAWLRTASDPDRSGLNRPPTRFAFDSLATAAAAERSGARRRFGWSAGLNALLLVAVVGLALRARRP